MIVHRGDFGQTRFSEIDDNPLAYIVNFDQGGYAILGADKRIASVIAIAQEQSLTPSELVAAKLAVGCGENVSTLTYLNSLTADYMINASDDLYRRSLTGAPYGSEWIVSEKQSPLLKTLWNQSMEPGNSRCYNSYGRICPAGCVPIAFAQILAYNHWKNDVGNFYIKCEGLIRETYFPDWEKLDRAASGLYGPYASTYPDDVKEEISKFVYYVGQVTYVDYQIDGSGAYPMDAAEFLIGQTDFFRGSTGYKNVFYTGVSSSPQHYTMINEKIREKVYLKNLPVLMGGMDNTATYAHAWVVDGYELWRSKPQCDGCPSFLETKVWCNYGNGASYFCEFEIFTAGGSNAIMYSRHFDLLYYDLN